MFVKTHYVTQMPERNTVWWYLLCDNV